VALYRNRGLGDTAFGAGPFPAATFLSPLLAAVRREFPGVNLRVEINNWQLLVQRLREEDIEFFVADTRDLPADPLLQVRALRQEPGGFYVRAGHPLLAARKAVALDVLWPYGVASVRLPVGVRSVIARLLGLASPDALSVALQCDDVEILKKVALASNTVLAAPHAAVEGELATRSLHALTVAGLPPLYADMGVVTLRGRTPSPMAELIMARLPPDGLATGSGFRGKVTAFANGKEAHERLQEEPFSLLLTDIVMPQMDGIELARRASELDPQIKIMFITGFAAVTLNTNSRAPKNARVLSKPFHLKDLVREIDRLLAL